MFANPLIQENTSFDINFKWNEDNIVDVIFIILLYIY